MNAPAVDALVRFYETLTRESVALLPTLYADDAWFKDPFNEVRGVAAIRRIFEHMYEQVAEPRFVVTERIVDGNAAVLVWEFHYRNRAGQRAEAQLIRGVSHLKFDATGKVAWHRDYWDAAEELYMKLPGIGWLLRGLRRMLAA